MGAGIGALYALSGFAEEYSGSKLRQKHEKRQEQEQKDKLEAARIKGLITIFGDPDNPSDVRQNALDAYNESPFGGKGLLQQGIDLTQIVKGFEEGSKPKTLTPPPLYGGQMPDGSVARPDPQLHPAAAVQASPRRNQANAFAQGQVSAGPPTQPQPSAGPPTQPQVSAGPPTRPDVSAGPPPFPQADVEQTITQALGSRPQNEFSAMRWDTAANKMKQDIAGRYFQQRFEKKFAADPALTPYLVEKADDTTVPAYIDRESGQFRDFNSGEVISNVVNVHSVGTDRESAVTAYRDYRAGELAKGTPIAEIPKKWNRLLASTRPTGLGLLVTGVDENTNQPIYGWIPPGQRRGEEPPKVTPLKGIRKKPLEHPLATQIQKLEREEDLGSGAFYKRLGQLSFIRQGIAGKSKVEAREEGKRVYAEYLSKQGRGRSLEGGPPEQRSKEDERVDELINEMKGGKR